MDAYLGLKYPNRAESLDDYSGYKIFLDPWNPLARKLKEYYETLAIRRESHILAIHGPQGTGKTMFANKLTTDFVNTKNKETYESPDANNLWHRITGGFPLRKGPIKQATENTDVYLVENTSDWVAKLEEKHGQRSDRARIIVADNAERIYFRQGLVAFTNAEYMSLTDKSTVTEMAAQRLVELCRTDFRGSLLIILSNDKGFLKDLDDAVERQHNGLLTIEELPLPDKKSKEAVVRVNTNRLNNVSYWYCVDKSGRDEKVAIKKALEGAATFPDSFQAVDKGLRTADPSRTGRPANKNVITLVSLVNMDDVTSIDSSIVGELGRQEASKGWLAINILRGGWTKDILPKREGQLLESEWQLRVVFVGNPFIKSLLSLNHEGGDDSIKSNFDSFFKLLANFQGIGTRDATRKSLTDEFHGLVDNWISSKSVDMNAFWDMGQARASAYESALRRVLDGYDTKQDGFMGYRPDYTVSDFVPCSVVSALGEDHDSITSAIRRNAHVFEFTAFGSYTADNLRSYLGSKLDNYVQVTQEQ